MLLLQVWQEAVLVSWNQVWSSFVSFLPSLVGAVIVFVVGILIASWAKRLVGEILKVLRIEDLSQSSGFAGYLKRADIRMTATELVSEVVRWLLLLVFFIAAAEILGLAVVSTVLTGLLSYLPNVFAAGLILGAGAFIANLADGLVRGALVTVDHDAAKPVGKLARWVVLSVAFFAAVDQIKIAQSLVDTFFEGLTWTLVLAIGLSVGLGTKDLVARILDGWYKKLQHK